MRRDFTLAMVVGVFLGALVLSFLIGETAAAAPIAQSEPAPTVIAEPSAPVSDKFEISDSRVAVIELPEFPLNVYPGGATGPSGASRYYHEQWPVVEFPTTDIYDANTRRLNFTINLAKEIPSDILLRAKQMILGGANDIEVAGTVLMPLELEAYELYLVRGNQRVLLASGLPVNGPFGPRLFVSEVIQDETLHQVLADDPSVLSLDFRPYYRFKPFSIQSAVLSIIQSASSSTLEDVLGIAPDGEAIVNRNVLNEVAKSAVTNVRRQVPADASQALVESLDAMVSEFLNMPAITFDDLSSVDDTLYYRAGNAQIEIEPDVLREFLTSWTTSDAFRSTFETTWNNIHELATESSTSEEYFNRLRDELHTSGGSKASVDIIKLASGSGSFNFSLDKTWEEQTEEQRASFDSFHEIAISQGSLSDETLRNVAESFTGSREYTSVTSQDIKLYRVSDVSIRSALKIITEIVEELPTYLGSRTVSFALTGPSTVVGVDLANLPQQVSSSVASTLRADEEFRNSLIGPQGPAGPQGATGAVGTRGPQGEQGPPGPLSAKVCFVYQPDQWAASINVPQGWNRGDCVGWAESLGAPWLIVGCVLEDGRSSWGPRFHYANVDRGDPSPNCGW